MAQIGDKIELGRTWTITDVIGSGGFAVVYGVEAEDGESGAAKLVPKTAGAERELLLVELGDVRNVVPVIESGEHGDTWVLVMPRAETSLRGYLTQEGGSLDSGATVAVMKDVVDALEDLDGRIVHRDLKPENVLLIDGRWCLTDFGISRYAEASTAEDTRKFAHTPRYTAPERWRNEHATSAADVYSAGVMAYELHAGSPPFPGPSTDDYREQHLHDDPPPLAGAPPLLASLVAECLFKAPGTRPRPANLRARLDKALPVAEGSAGLGRLQEANKDETERQQSAQARASVAKSEQERREAIMQAADSLFDAISSSLRSTLADHAPSATVRDSGLGGWELTLNEAKLSLVPPREVPSLNAEPYPFDLIAVSGLTLRAPSNRTGYSGRSHSLWYGDIQTEGEYAWFETSFMFMPLMGASQSIEPFALGPGAESLGAVTPGMDTHQVAWPFTRLEIGALDEFIDRWATWLADAAQGRLQHPSPMPEHPPEGSWRQH